MNPTLLVELFTEELPPKALLSLGEAFSELLANALKQAGHLTANSQIKTFASPRRLGCQITDVLAKSPDEDALERLLPAKIGLDGNGQPTPPLLKKLSSLGLEGVAASALESISDGKQDVLHIRRKVIGKALAESLAGALEQATTKLPIPKVMSYQRPDGSTVKFVRPAHRLVALHGEQVLPVEILGLKADRLTLGHRFLSSGVINLKNADGYAEQLKNEGKVIASFAERREAIAQHIELAAKPERAVQPDALIDEVCALVEWPVVYEGHFEEAFLEVPQECLILTMQANQKYFAITDQNGQMRNRFLLVSNLETETPHSIIHGNERVLRARLADAKFFFDQDRKRSLESRIEGLAQVVYHNKLGSQKDRNERLVALAQWLAPFTGAEPALAQRAALLCKADLLTDMVGEFPELQGNMGEHYAQHDGEKPDVAQAIADHYSPRFAGDTLPRNAVGLAVALADKIETMVGIYGIGLIPTGDKDPFALRRHALGVIRMVIERKLPLNIKAALKTACGLFSGYADFSDSSEGVYQFMLDRLRGYLREQGYSAAEVESVLAQQPEQFTDLVARLEAVRAFSALEQADALAAANKRITNILKKAEGTSAAFSANLLREPAEKALADKVKAIEPSALQAFANGNFQEALALLAPLRPEVDAFFNDVMVMDKDESLKNNRIALLSWMHGLMNKVADISQLAKA